MLLPEVDPWVYLGGLPGTTDGHGLTQFNLYMIRIKSLDKSRNMRLNIKFRCNHFSKRYIGPPIYIWINQHDTLQFVIDQYLSRIRKFILYAYKIKDGDKFKKRIVARDRWSKYILKQRMDPRNDILLFEIKNINASNAFCSILGDDVHQKFDKQ